MASPFPSPILRVDIPRHDGAQRTEMVRGVRGSTEETQGQPPIHTRHGRLKLQAAARQERPLAIQPSRHEDP